ncbi:MAG: flavin reductase family protein [Promethearchaeota archaeon]
MNKDLDTMVLRLITYGLYVVSSKLGEKVNGQIVNTVFQVTSEPPCIAVCINKQNLTHEYISKSRVFSVSILDEETPMTFIGLFGFKSGRDVDKLCDVAYQKGIDNCPIVTEHSLGILEVRVLNQLDVGTHTLFVGKIERGRILREGTPLTYAHYHQVKGGKAPKTAPTYIASTPKTAPTYIPPSD